MLSSSCVKRVISKSNDDLPVHYSPSNLSSPSVISSSCSYICSICQKITPLLLCWICTRITVIFLMIIWIYIQTPSIWSNPMIPFHSFISHYRSACLTFPYIVSELFLQYYYSILFSFLFENFIL